MKNNNRGFTLVELIVSVAILGVVALGVAGFIIAGTKTYSSVNTTVRLQYESQLVMDQIQKYVMDCSDGVAWDGNTLYIADGGGMYMFTYASSRLALCSINPAVKNPNTEDKYKTMAEHITGMTVTPALTDDGHAISLQITLTLTLNGKSYTGSQTVALRNRPLYAKSWDGLWQLMYPEANPGA